MHAPRPRSVTRTEARDGRFHYDHDATSVEALQDEGPKHQPGPLPEQGEGATGLAKNRLVQWFRSIKKDDEGPARFSLPKDSAVVRRHGLPRSAGEPIPLWRDDQPLKRDPDYQAAKAGDIQAAVRLVERNGEQLAKRAERRFGPHVVYLAAHAQEASGRNAIPGVLAEFLAARTAGSAAAGPRRRCWPI